MSGKLLFITHNPLLALPNYTEVHWTQIANVAFLEAADSSPL